MPTVNSNIIEFTEIDRCSFMEGGDRSSVIESVIQAKEGVTEVTLIFTKAFVEAVLPAMYRDKDRLRVVLDLMLCAGIGSLSPTAGGLLGIQCFVVQPQRMYAAQNKEIATFINSLESLANDMESMECLHPVAISVQVYDHGNGINDFLNDIGDARAAYLERDLTALQSEGGVDFF